jgi:hypothetical protein
MARFPRLVQEAIYLSSDELQPHLKYSLLRDRNHVSLAPVAEVFEDHATIPMGGHTPAAIVVNDSHITVLSISAQELVIEGSEALKRRIIGTRPIGM